MRAAPKAIWALVAISAVSIIVVCALNFRDRPGIALLALGFMALLSYFLLRGSRVVWVLFIVGVVWTLALGAADEESWWSIVLAVIDAVLLLMPSSLHYVWRSRPGRSRSVSPPGPQDPGDRVAALGGRPAGWYVDPSEPNRMRYWNPDTEQWTGSTRTPRRTRNAWLQSRPSGDGG